MQDLKAALLVYNERKRAQLIDFRDPKFPKQDAFVTDPARYIAAQCTRRAGKSNGLALRFGRTLKKYPGCFCPYIALTRESARNIMWDILQEWDDRFKIGARFTIANLTMTTPDESRLQLFGADMKNFIKRLKGIKTPGAAIDEAQDFGTHITQLVDDVLAPTIADYSDGWLALTGTPGPVPIGLFHDITRLRKYGYNIHKWSIFDNPYMPDAAQFVEDYRLKKGWDKQHPTYLREWMNEWVLDLEALVFKYQASLNHFDAAPPSNHWEYVIGVDIGYHDADAIAVVGWSAKDKPSYLVEEHLKEKQGITQLMQQIEALMEKYKPLKIVMDTGGLGKKIAEELRMRYAIPVEAAEKTRKFEYIELLNDALRNQRFFAKQDSQFAQDATRVKWETDLETEKLKISDHFHSDICDAVLYAFRESLHWLYEPEPVKLRPMSPEWIVKQEQDMIVEAERTLKRQNEMDLWGDFDEI